MELEHIFCLHVLPRLLYFIPGMHILAMHTDAFGIIFNVCLGSEPIGKMPVTSPSACIYTCERLNGCGYVLYTRITQTCELHLISTEITGKRCRGNALFPVFHIGQNANKGEKHCPGIHAAENVAFLGNRREIGSKRRLECAPSYDLIGESTIICNSSGQWTINGKCMQTCGSPIATQYMALNVNRSTQHDTAINSRWEENKIPFYENSSIVISCLNGTTLIGSPSITCIAGSWTELPVCSNTTMRLSCKENSDCVDINSQCRDDQCWCKPDLSHNPVNLTCVTSCDEYGNTFQIVKGMGIPGFNYEITGGKNEEDCMNQCLSYDTARDTDYRCKHVDFVYGRNCYLTSDLPVLPNAASMTGITYLLRDCTENHTSYKPQ